MSRQLQIKTRDYWILSEPIADGWRAWVLDTTAGDREDVGIVATAETRSAADAAAERKLRRLLGESPLTKH